MIRPFVYDATFLKLTARWYSEVLKRLPEGTRLLDVGVGTGGALLANADMVTKKRLHVTGIDIDADYVERARDRLQKSSLSERTEVLLESVYEHQGGPYGAVYFSASFMILPEPEQALRHCCELLDPDGRFYFTQTFEKNGNRLVEKLKPMLKWLTSIEFGRVTYEDDFRTQLRAAGLELEEFATIDSYGGRAACIAVARPVRTRPTLGQQLMKDAPLNQLERD